MSTDPDQPFSPLVASILTANATETARVTNLVIENLERQLDEAKALLAAVEEGVGALISGPHMPTTHAIERALYPPSHVVDRYRKDQSQ